MRFHFLEKYTRRFWPISDFCISLGIKREIFVQYCSKWNAQMTQQRLNLGQYKNLRNWLPSSPVLWIESLILLIQIFHKQNSKHLNKILGHTRTLLSVFHSIRLHDFFSHKSLVTFFLHRTEPFVLYTRSLEFCSLNFVHVKDTTKQWRILDSVG